VATKDPCYFAYQHTSGQVKLGYCVVCWCFCIRFACS